MTTDPTLDEVLVGTAQEIMTSSELSILGGQEGVLCAFPHTHYLYLDTIVDSQTAGDRDLVRALVQGSWAAATSRWGVFSSQCRDGVVQAE